ncbi:hypothetical protein JR316_0012782 [Psilocybe cubensis]|uniref:Uncharacterized protein n=2 Tax=Psilocybe cubensis TaxID=181762 RepID=A0ACB8GFE5_PSICU|nr:hypothetical protein JR316_0012782 [Psilocybe cubensis]KAH9474324.1 hypothetical protein JR316_0012782 [Psilocybe cubensis]
MGRKSKRSRLVEGEVDAAQYVTVRKVRKVDEDGKVDVQRIIKPVQDPRASYKQQHNGAATGSNVQDEWEYHNNGVNDNETILETPKKKTQKDYILQFVQRVDTFLGALLSREALLDNERLCQSCRGGKIAIWRCKDCALGRTMCRKCLRHAHMEDPFHRVECWNGKNFRSAELWEVGSTVVVPHHTGTRICDSLQLQTKQLEESECIKDEAEQHSLRRAIPTVDNAPVDIAQDGEIDGDNGKPNGELEQRTTAAADINLELLQDQNFFEYLDALCNGSDSEPIEEPDDDAEASEENGEDETEPTNWNDMNYNHAARVRVVHTNGIHHISLVTCSCSGMHNIPCDLIAFRLWPTSFIRIRTLFSAQVLDGFRLANLELHASAYQFYHLLRRITSPMNPSGVVDLYNEFRRMTRLWRWTKKLKWAGYAGHNGKKVAEVENGELANYCPACPQPGINLPSNWEEDPNRFVYRQILMADGNFKADHVQPKKPSHDVWLSEGSGIIPNREEYHAFLKSAIEKLTVWSAQLGSILTMLTKENLQGAPCENTFRAITGALQASKSCDVTGVVGIACARHGCYAPNSLVDLFKGEQQKNVDFALLAAIKSTGVHPKQGLMFMYDVICQFFVYVKERIGHLLPEGLDLDRAIGLFHVHAHKDECLFCYSPSFIPGAARVIGEILETLWAKLNGISPTARTATLAHRAEMLDDHATDSNHKKALDMPKDLCRRYVEAIETRDSTQKYFAEVSQVVPQDLVNLWTCQITDAEAQRLTTPNVMDIYAAKGRGQDGEALDSDAALITEDPVEAYIQFALIVEEKEIEIRLCVRQLTKLPRHADPHKIQTLRDKLRPLLGELERLQEGAGIIEENTTRQGSIVELLDWADECSPDEVVEERQATAPSVELIEDHKICLPSHGNASRSLAPHELKMRIFQAKSHLNKIRNLIAEKSFQYSNVICKAPRKGVRTRSRAKIDDMNHQITFYSQLYTECWARLILLGADNATLQKFQVLKKEDVKTSTAILDPNTPGSTRVQLSWIWHTAIQRLGPNIIAEGGEFHVANAENGAIDLDETDPETLTEFKRVHWLRARAQFQRWNEEATILDYEMLWTVNYFVHKAEWWRCSASVHSNGEVLVGDMVQRGRIAYAERQASLWDNLARQADYLFRMTNPNYKKQF